MKYSAFTLSESTLAHLISDYRVQEKGYQLYTPGFPRFLCLSFQTYSVAASWATNRVWFNYEPTSEKLTVEGRGSNATALETDIGTYNGVIHVIDTFLGIPHLTIAQKMREDPLLR